MAQKALKCSDPECGEDILGVGCVVTDAGEPSDELEDMHYWGNLEVYPSTNGGFVLLHPNCFKVFQDELLRQERGAVLTVSFGKIDWIREALLV